MPTVLPTSLGRSMRRPLVVLSVGLGLSVLVGTAPGSATGAVPTPVASASSSAPGAIQYAWTTAPIASRYRLLYSAKPYGGFLDRPTPWLSSSTRRATLRVGSAYSADAGQRAVQTALPYGNPLYARLQTTNGRSVRNSAWTAGAFPGIPTPAAGRTVRVGTWNLGQNTTDVTAIADRIRAGGLGVVALQESRTGTDRVNMADRLARALGDWRSSGANPTQQQQLIYDASKYTAERSGTLAVTNYKSGGQLLMPYVRLVPVDGSRPFWAVSAHFVVSTSGTITDHNQQTARDADQLTRAIADLVGSDPVLAAGDFTSNREPYTTSNTGAQQIFVQRGYWDTRASLARYGVAYSTYNGMTYPQQLSPVRVSSRADYIMTKGIHGSTIYSNVANQRVPLSDHNLVWSEVRVPLG